MTKLVCSGIPNPRKPCEMCGQTEWVRIFLYGRLVVCLCTFCAESFYVWLEKKKEQKDREEFNEWREKFSARDAENSQNS